ncbi:hypothetical protein ACI2LF_26815 [Kribbella sp. NPDC020789]
MADILAGVDYHRLTHEDPKNPLAQNPALARRLWTLSAELTGIPADVS